jgi:hypothetical protein
MLLCNPLLLPGLLPLLLLLPLSPVLQLLCPEALKALAEPPLLMAPAFAVATELPPQTMLVRLLLARDSSCRQLRCASCCCTPPPLSLLPLVLLLWAIMLLSLLLSRRRQVSCGWPEMSGKHCSWLSCGKCINNMVFTVRLLPLYSQLLRLAQ